MKQIKQFRIENHGLFLDLVDAAAAVSVEVGTGCILLDEGYGDDRFHGAVIFPDDFQKLILEPEGQGYSVILDYGDGDAHHLGDTQDHTGAIMWVSLVTLCVQTAKRNRSSLTETKSWSPVALNPAAGLTSRAGYSGVQVSGIGQRLPLVGAICEIAVDQGFGFIQVDQQNYFFHECVLDHSALNTLHRGQKVRFAQVDGPQMTWISSVSPI